MDCSVSSMIACFVVFRSAYTNHILPTKQNPTQLDQTMQVWKHPKNNKSSSYQTEAMLTQTIIFLFNVILLVLMRWEEVAVLITIKKHVTQMHCKCCWIINNDNRQAAAQTTLFRRINRLLVLVSSGGGGGVVVNNKVKKWHQPYPFKSIQEVLVKYCHDSFILSFFKFPSKTF